MVEISVIDKAEMESMGIEFECGYSTMNRDLESKLRATVNDFTIDYDGSVYVLDATVTNAELKFWSSDICNLTNAIDILFTKAKAKQNATCSNHRHVRFKHAQKILSEQFKLKKVLLRFREDYLRTFQNDLYIARLNNYYSRNSLEWSDSEIAYELAKRFFGSRAYEERHDRNYEQREYKKQFYEETRYYFINFCSYYEHKTIEFRVYPNVSNADEFHQQTLHLKRFIENFEPIYKIYHVKNEYIDLYVSRINRKYIVLEVKWNEIANKLTFLDGFRYKSKYDSQICSFAYADRTKRELRLSEIDSINAKIIENDRLNYVVFRIIEGYWKLRNDQIENMKIKELVKLIANELENFIDIAKTKFKVI